MRPAGVPRHAKRCYLVLGAHIWSPRKVLCQSSWAGCTQLLPQSRCGISLRFLTHPPPSGALQPMRRTLQPPLGNLPAPSTSALSRRPSVQCGASHALMPSRYLCGAWPWMPSLEPMCVRGTARVTCTEHMTVPRACTPSGNAQWRMEYAPNSSVLWGCPCCPGRQRGFWRCPVWRLRARRYGVWTPAIVGMAP